MGERQNTESNSRRGDIKLETSFVPQGSVLGPILFLIFLNDLDDDLSSKVLTFADHTKVFRTVKTNADKKNFTR